MPKIKLPPFQRARQPEQIEQRREAILRAALALFQKKGLENVTLADIADRVGTAKSNIYRYFDSHEHIYLRVLQRQGEEWEKRVMPGLHALKGKGTAAEVAEVITEAFVHSEEYSTLSTVINPLHIFTHVAGLWPVCHPAPHSKKLLSEPGLAHLNLDFATEMTRFLIRFLGCPSN
jgi:AcrR family transcriptional regulator